jgi:alpha-N-arabinofuranosidase
MTEEINHAYDGGLYAELIQNRAFKDSDKDPVHWQPVMDAGAAGTLNLDSDAPQGTALTKSLRLDIDKAAPGQVFGVANDGFWGIPVWQHAVYQASFYAKASLGFRGPVIVRIETNDDKVLVEAKLPSIDSVWRKYNVSMLVGKVPPSTANRFVVAAQSPGTIWLTQISLFPPTFHNRLNGNRPDLMDLLAGLRPSFLRLPGGNYLEGNSVDERFNWKQTLGNIESRPGHQGPWGYRSSDGMGLLEFLEWTQDLNMEPLLAVYAGYSLGSEYVSQGGKRVSPGPDLVPFVDDALDEIEYVTGSVKTNWGARRAQDGHAAPFPLHFVEIGNEDQFDDSHSYDARFAQFYDAIKARYPALQIIATTNVTSRKPDLVDDHYYRSAAAMAGDAHHYDRYSRIGPKIFVGEWASVEGNPTPTMQAALGDAAWLTGLERNSDLVLMESYAPLFVNVNPGASQWGTNLIGYDALRSFGSPSYWVQRLFAENTGVNTVPTQLVEPPQPPPPAFQGAVGVGTYGTQAEFKDLRVTSSGPTLPLPDLSPGLPGWHAIGGGQWAATGGVLSQTGDANGTEITAGDASWTDYTLHVRARKTGGREGFLIVFHAADPQNFWCWNIGGWGNTRTVIQHIQGFDWAEIGRAKPSTVETNRWYDVDVEVKGGHVRCLLDGKVVLDTRETSQVVDPLYAVASKDSKSGDIILKVVNFATSPEPMKIDVVGAGPLAKVAHGWVLTGPRDAVNTVANPLNVSPKPISVSGIGKTFTDVFPPNSVTVLRLRPRS